ncbi:DUF4625 domain-containing protein [Pedobacter agri]|uniref:DUF4625 domain-containing protein n=1 Tax=Pedobacter agri TaxID=454586 RepID=UPI0029300F1B|nr:DUF4625 domain-containing protein [Pedobacter agri]
MKSFQKKMQTLTNKQSFKAIIVLLLSVMVFSGCKKEDITDKDNEIAKAKLENVELGLGDAGIGVISQDFHFNADIIAADRIDKVEVRMLQKSDETYAKPWEHAMVWAQYRSLKNANIHKHFTIPKDAPEGKYDFLITVYDQNGSKLELKRNLAIYKQENLPVDPMITQLNLTRNWNFIFDIHGKAANPTEIFLKGDILTSQAGVSFVKDNGILYMLLIKKSANHHPKTVEEIDFNKAIVFDMYEHKNEKSVYSFSNFLADPNDPFITLRNIPEFIIGAANDNKVPIPNPIAGNKAWESGEYNLVVIYKNTTHNKTTHKTVPFMIDYK